MVCPGIFCGKAAGAEPANQALGTQRKAQRILFADVHPMRKPHHGWGWSPLYGITSHLYE